MDIEKENYRVLKDGMVLNSHYKKGDEILLYPVQAQNLIAPFGAQLELIQNPVGILTEEKDKIKEA